MSGFAEIWNLDEVALWTAAGAHAKPRLEWSTTDPDADAIGSHRVKIYDAASGGSMVFDSTQLAGNPGFMNCNYAMKNKDQASNERWWTIETWDALGQSSGESTRTAFKVCWGQAIYEYAVPSGASTSGWAFSSAGMPTDTKSAFLFRNATGASGAGAGAWNASMGSVTPAAYVNVLVRLSTRTAGTQPTLSDMTFSYLASSTVPDHWTRVGSWALDPATYRYGTRAIKVAHTGAVAKTLTPFRVSAGDDIPVQPNTAYVFSCYVKTSGSLGAYPVNLKFAQAGTGITLAVGSPAGDSYNDGPGATADTSGYIEGWQRIHLRYTTAPGEALIRPIIEVQCDLGGSGNTVWIDAAQLEEGTVVSPWHVGQVSAARLSDGYGLMLDAISGGSVRARASDGAIATLDQIVHAAAGGGGGVSESFAFFLGG
jgi:hypothetical protein